MAKQICVSEGDPVGTGRGLGTRLLSFFENLDLSRRWFANSLVQLADLQANSSLMTSDPSSLFDCYLRGFKYCSIFRAEFESQPASKKNMRDINVSEGIVPLGEFKTKASKIIRDIADSDELLVITQNGRPAAVLMSPAAFQEMRERHEFVLAVAEGIADSETGRVVDHKKVRRWLESWGTDQEKAAPK